MQEPSEIITSRPFKLSRKDYERYVAMRWARRRWWLIAIPIAAAASASVILADARWLLVALMYLFIVTPGIISMAYFRYLLTPEARLTALRKRVAINPGQSITIEYLADQKGDAEEDDDAEAGATEPEIERSEVIAWSEVRYILYQGSNYVIELQPHPWPRFLLVPRKALSHPIPWELM